MPYYSAKQPPAEQLEVARLLTEDRRLHLYRDDHIIVCKPRLDRFLAGIFGKSLTVASLWIGGTFAALLGLHYVQSFNAAETALMLTAGSTFLWWLAGPDDLDLDLRRRTYQYRKGFLYLAQTQTGPFDDILTVGVQSYGFSTRSNGPHCFLLLVWNNPRRRPAFLGQFQTLEQANAQRDLIADKLALYRTRSDEEQPGVNDVGRVVGSYGSEEPWD